MLLLLLWCVLSYNLDLTFGSDFDKARSECYEEVSIWGGRRNGDKQLLECCMGIMMTVCITAKCQQEPLKTSATDLCKREMFDVLPECRKYKKEECDQLRPTWVWIFAIVVVTVVLLALISLIVLVFYRKFYRAGRPKGPIKVRWAGGANVDTHGKKKKKKSKSRSNSSRAGGSRAAPDDASNVT